MSNPGNPLSGDPARVTELFKEFHQWYRQYVDDCSNAFDRLFEFNKQIAAFHERLLLISLGTIGLSVTALTSFIPKIPAQGFPKHTFVWLIAPAWVLLLLSSITSAALIGHTIVANQISHHELRKIIGAHNYRLLWLHLTKLSGALSGTAEVNSQEQDVSTLFSKLAEEVEKVIRQTSEAVIEGVMRKAALDQSSFGRMSRAAMVSLYLGLLLLCISAIKLFLSVQ